MEYIFGEVVRPQLYNNNTMITEHGIVLPLFRIFRGPYMTMVLYLVHMYGLYIYIWIYVMYYINIIHGPDFCTCAGSGTHLNVNDKKINKIKFSLKWNYDYGSLQNCETRFKESCTFVLFFHG